MLKSKIFSSDLLAFSFRVQVLQEGFITEFLPQNIAFQDKLFLFVLTNTKDQFPFYVTKNYAYTKMLLKKHKQNLSLWCHLKMH